MATAFIAVNDPNTAVAFQESADVPRISTPATGGFVIVADDTDALDEWARGFWTSASGDVTVEFVDGTEVTFPDLPAGDHPYSIKRVDDTDSEDESMTIIGFR